MDQTQNDNALQLQNNENIPEELPETVPAILGVEPVEVLTEDKTKELTVDDLQLSPKFDLFLELYTTPGTKEHPNKLFGNATQSYYAAYDPEKTKSNSYARKKGSELVAKGNLVAQEIFARRGLHYAGMLNIAANKVIATDNPRWWDIVAEHQGYNKDPKQVVAVTNNQFNMYSLDSKDVKDFNKDFSKFLEEQ